MRGTQGGCQDYAQLPAPYFLESCSTWSMGWVWVFFSPVSFLPPGLRRGKKHCLPLCIWLKAALWHWRDGNVARTGEMVGICKEGRLCGTYRQRSEAQRCAAIALEANEPSSSDQPALPLCSCAQQRQRGFLNSPVVAPLLYLLSLPQPHHSSCSINPVTGRVEEKLPNPMEGMTEEQKEYEAMKLVNMFDKLSRY